MPDKSETFIETTFGEPWKQSCSFDNFSQYKRGGVPPKQQQPSSQSQIQVVLPFSTIPDKFSACQISDWANPAQPLIQGCSLLLKTRDVHWGRCCPHALHDRPRPQPGSHAKLCIKASTKGFAAVSVQAHGASQTREECPPSPSPPRPPPAGHQLNASPRG